MPSFNSYLSALSSVQDYAETRATMDYTSYLEYATAEIQREMDRQFLEGVQWTRTKYKAPEGFKTVELNSNFTLIEGTIHRLR